MGLPVGQQRILDGIADALRASEPRLTSMFAIFARLTSNEPRPSQEQLGGWRPCATVLNFLSRVAGWRSGTGLRLLVFAQVAIALALLAVLVGRNTGSPTRCSSGRTEPVAASAIRPPCSDHHGSGLSAISLGK
jgi:hypothetical protein